MDDRQVAKWADDIVFSETGKHLDHIQQSILRGTWQRQKYPEIAKNCNRSSPHIRKEASKLWKLLSQTLGEDINQSNFRPTVERWQFSIVSSHFGDYAQVGKFKVCGNSPQSQQTPNSENSNQETSSKTKLQLRIDLGDAPEPTLFYNRTSELSTLENWILGRTRLITILGLSGIGKTALTLQLIPQIQHEFDRIIWRSLRNSPPLASLQTDLIQFFSQQQETELPYLIDYLRSHRCLIILDDIQTIFSSGQLAGNYQPGYENYGAFFKQITESSHNSCLILLSWEKPREIAALEGENRPCKSLQLNGLGTEAQEIFREKGLAEPEKWLELIDLYRGNPLWLNIVATMIQDLFGGSVSEFLSYDTLFLGDLESLLYQQCDRLSESEKQVIFWLASEAAPVEISKISANLELSPSSLLQAVQSLGRRLLIETVKQGEKTLFTLQPVLMEYVKNQCLKFG
ncbi:ATPase [Microcoleus sp. LEGE 07076]|uniref:NB-ARC domain-containing protein n=1 Tax=Microcoleus sp. LEGE 07076 TaxID=915322 RepID=UPI0018812C37|nr:NB-ARC domain-containing protein [Microcoleus sp. LEGE 07076]MBE9183493.1 ATPase [Microcoleus sp. LEGE 07076]